MLKSLSVKNFAIIEDIFISFKDGMTVLTGQTGAGKSLIIDTISLLLGQRADSDMIRYGEKTAIIEGVFSYDNSKINELLEKYGLNINNDITIYRQIEESGKNIIRINNSSVSLTILKQIVSYLANIHVQNDTFKLLNQDSYLDMICPLNDDEYNKLFSFYTISYSKYLEFYDKYKKILKGKNESVQKLEYMQYEYEELKNLNLKENLDENLAIEIAKLENYDKLYSNLTEAFNLLENEYFSLDSIYDSANNIKKIANLDNNYQELYEKMLDCYYILDEAKSEIYNQVNSLDFNQDELNKKIEQLNLLEKTKIKYNRNLKELIKYYNDLSLEIKMVNNYDDVLNEAKDNVIKSFNTLKENALNLSKYRKDIAKNIEKNILKECNDLDLVETNFLISFEEIKLDDPFNNNVFSENGIDVVDFKISFNQGEPLKSLNKVASGGELSRIMLAFKSYFAKKSNLSLMVFDEIDTGVSGKTAKKIALKMKSISKINQVLCITHLPQVAAIGDNHIHIFKKIDNNRTTTHYKNLTFDERVEEIAIMISGDNVSLYALDNAKAMINENKTD